MAELAPWLSTGDKVSEKKLSDLVTGDNVAPWLVNKEPEVGYAEDMAKVAAPALAKGVMSVAGTPGDLQELAKVADEKGYNPFGWLAGKVEGLKDTKVGKAVSDFNTFMNRGDPNFKPSEALTKSGDIMGGGTIELPSSRSMQKSVESVTGPFYEAKTGPGKAFGGALEVAPALATGPVGGVRGLAAKSAGAGIAGELAAEGAEAVKDKLPTAVQPWAEPVARTVGTIGGMFTPAGARKVITPLPMADEQLNVVNALRKSDPEFAKTATAGQLTQSPRLMGLEARSFPGQAEKQGKAFTEATLARGEDTGKRIGQIYDTNSINSTEFPVLNQQVSQAKRALGGITGTADAQAALGEIQQAIRLGAANSPNTLSMTGKRYQYLRDRVQGAIEAEPNNTVKKALTNVKTSLDDAFDRSLGQAGAENLATLRRQKQTHEALANRTPTIDSQVTPQSVLSAAAHAEGNRAVNTGRSPLAEWARDADKVMTPLPTPRDTAPPWFDLLNTTAFALAHGGAGGAAGHAGMGLPGAIGLGTLAGSEGGVLGHLLKDAMYNTGAKAASKVVSNAPAQRYLANQAWRPGASSTMDRDQLIRLLMSPEAKPGQPQ